jgi:hypothetical protein
VTTAAPPFGPRPKKKRPWPRSMATRGATTTERINCGIQDNGAKGPRFRGQQERVVEDEQGELAVRAPALELGTVVVRG